MHKSPAFQFYAAEYLADENVALMTLAEEGAYTRAMAYCWREGSIPADNERLALLLKGAPPEILDVVRARFKPHAKDSSRLIHPRLEKERKKQADWRKKSSEAGKKSGKVRRQKKLDTKPTFTNGSTNLEPNSEPNTNSSSSTSSSTSSSEVKGDARDGAVPPATPEPLANASTFPDGLSELQYAQGILEHCSIVDTFRVRDALGKAVVLLSKQEKSALHVAAEAMEARIVEAQSRGDTVNVFWLEDSRWKPQEANGNGANQSNRGAAVGRVERSVAAWGRAATELRGTRDPDDPV